MSSGIATITLFVTSTCFWVIMWTSHAISGALRQPPDRNADTVLEHLAPLLEARGQVASVYYGGNCQGGALDAVFFPNIRVRPAADDGFGLAAVRQLFENDKNVDIAVTSDGIVRIRIGQIPQAILETKLAVVRLTADEQYNAILAIGALESSPEIASVLRKFDFRWVPIFLSYRLNKPMEAAAHLPTLLEETTLDRALDKIAKIFNGVVLVGSCTQYRKLEIDFVPLNAKSGDSDVRRETGRE